jgi:CheY-like chemotaxis protein
LATSPDAGLRIHDLVAPAVELESLLEANACPLILLADAAECARLKPLLAHRRGIEVLTRPLTPLTLARAFQQLGTSSAPAPALPELAVPREFGGATVAVAEDMMVNQQVIVGLLEKAGIRVCLAENGKALLEMLATATTPPELIFMDLHMPEMDGFEAARALRAKGYPHPIIALSAGVSAQEQSRCTDAGMNDFLAKPIDLDELWGVLTRWLKPRESPLPPITQSRPSSAPDGGMLADAGILVEEALTRFLGDAPALQRAIGAFIEQHRRDADAMRTLLQANEQRNLEALAHGLKGAAATIGARQLESLARTLEHLPGPLPRPEVQSIIDDVAAGISRIEKAARSRQLSDGR